MRFAFHFQWLHHVFLVNRLKITEENQFNNSSGSQTVFVIVFVYIIDEWDPLRIFGIFRMNGTLI